MKTKIFFFVVIILCGIGLQAFEQKPTKKITLHETDSVYQVPGSKLFHLLTCEEVKNRYLGMPLYHALLEKLEPCPKCIPTKEEIIPTRETIPPTQEEVDYLNKVMSTSLSFKVPKSKADEVWGRIQSFIGKYASMKIQTATDFVFETYNPPKGERKFGYSAIRTPMGNQDEFEVRCFSNTTLFIEQAERNAHILAYYALTGEINPKFIDMAP